jgi:hypothetical protein
VAHIDAYQQITTILDAVEQNPTELVMFTPMQPIGLRMWLRPFRYELFMTALAHSIQEAEEYILWQYRSLAWQLYQHRARPVAYLFAPIIPEMAPVPTGFHKYLVMQYSIPSFVARERGRGWDALVVSAQDNRHAIAIAHEAGLTPMKKPITTLVSQVPHLDSVRKQLERPSRGNI